MPTAGVPGRRMKTKFYLKIRRPPPQPARHVFGAWRSSMLSICNAYLEGAAESPWKERDAATTLRLFHVLSK